MLTNKNKIYGILLLAASVLAAALIIYLYTSTCYDGKKSRGETGIDCGGKCPPCIDSFREEFPLKCYNGNRDADNGETGIDCGGKCPPCPLSPAIDCKTAKIEIIPENPECNEEVTFRCNLLSGCNPVWHFSTGDRRNGCETAYTFTSGTNTVMLYADTVKIYEKSFEVECPPAVAVVEPLIEEISPVITPTCNDGIQNGDETGIDCGGSCNKSCPPKINCSNIIAEITPKGKLEPNETITFTCNLPADCNPIWDFGNGKEKSGHQVTNTFLHAGEYTVKVYADGVRVGTTEVIITRTPAPPVLPVSPDCTLEIEADGDRCNEDITFTCGISSPDGCNIYWIFDGQERMYGCEVKYKFSSEGEHHYKVYAGGTPVQASINITCPTTTSLPEESTSLKNDLQAIVTAIRENETWPKRRHLNTIIYGHGFCGGEDARKNTRVHVDRRYTTLKDYIMRTLNRNTIIESVTLERDTNGCINFIIIQDEN